jgi:penicillin G amidase
MRAAVRSLWRVLGIVLVLPAVLWFGGRCWLARSVARYDGTVASDVAQPVEITFDAKGVPQIWAKTDADAYYAIGYLHASERLFQMELVRRLARGELSEVFGAAAYETDEFQRRIGFARRARNAPLSPAARIALQRYADGVNAWVAQAKVLPPEFVILRIRPRAWMIDDSLAISNYQTWFSHALMDQDQTYQKLIAKLGMSGSALAHAGHPWSPTTVSPSYADDLLGLSRLRVTGASNSWVVAPSRSASHAALHESDPHLAIDQIPGLWYLAGLHSDEGLNVVGVTYAGGPFVVMGHNDAIAFSFTVASVDLIDYYDDRARGPAIREEIRVKGEAKPRVVEIRDGTRGVMLDEKTSLRWAGFDFSPGVMTDAGVELQRARNFDEFRRAITRFGALDANWVYSDRAGNIGYQLGAPIPIRDYDSFIRQPASDPRTVWRGYRQLGETPHALNPKEGFLASCNNQIVPPQWPYAVPGFYDPYRIGRALGLLAEKHTRDDMHAMQLDLSSGIARRWLSLAVAGAKRAGLYDQSRMLATWDTNVRVDSKPALLFETWWRVLPREVFEDELGSDWNEGATLVDEALTTRSPVIDDHRTPNVETIVDIAARAMRNAVPIANGRTWGEASTLRIQHPLARVKLLDWFLHLNRGAFPQPGDNATLDASFSGYRDGAFTSHVGPSMRFILDWSNVDAFTLTAALGQSGNPFSPHYDDFLSMMREGSEWNMPFTRQRVYAKRVSVLTLTPR